MLKLIGSTTSPYVRRIRLQLGPKEYDFEQVAIFTAEGQERVKQFAPTARVPLLIHGDEVIWDSLLIANHLCEQPLSLAIQKELVLINELTDSGIQLFQLRKFEIDIEDKGVFSQNNLKRMHQVLNYFDGHLPQEWNLCAQWLWCTLDWFDFRNVIDWRQGNEQLVQFYDQYKQREELKQTDPRK